MKIIGREIINNPALASQREWLVTNGIGGYASGTLINANTRSYHGLLVAALKPPLDRTLLVSKLDETVTYRQQTHPLFANQWDNAQAGFVPSGFLNSERFHLEGSIPVWTYAIGDARLEKRVWMESGANTTFIQYKFKYGLEPLTLQAKVLVNYRNFHSSTHAGDWQMQLEPVTSGLRVEPFTGATPFFLLSEKATLTITHNWHRNYFYNVEAYRGLNATEDNLHAGTFLAELQPGESVTIVATTEADAPLSGASGLARRVAYEENLIVQSGKACQPSWVQDLVRAADQFIVKRSTDEDADGRSIIAGYHWFEDWGRDTMISLPGLTLTTGRADEAAKILRTFALYIDQGMLPNRFPDNNETPEYNTVDATLWYIEAIRAYVDHTNDIKLLEDIFSVMEEVILWHDRGTRYGIHVDPNDGLLQSGEEGVQLTWMDAKVGDWVVTPRSGKVIEINALWYNALKIMAEFARQLGHDETSKYEQMANRVAENFGRFWDSELGYCYDVIDGPDDRNDAALRPNQLFAVSLPYSPLSTAQQKSVVDVCASQLLTSYGMRTLPLDHPDYSGQYGGGVWERDGSYHQGTVWPWLMGPFISAHLKVYSDKEYVRYLLQPLIGQLTDGAIGTLSEITDADPPNQPRGCMVQAWSVAEVLRVWEEISDGLCWTD